MTAGSIYTIPLFPLNTVLFPGGALPLRIFEPRYLDMVSHCLKTDEGIGVVLIEEGNETGRAASACNVGTLSSISYWHKRDDGMLGVTLFGEQRFKVLSTETQPNQLVVAEVELLSEYPGIELSEKEQSLVNLLKQIIAQLEPPFTTMDKFYENLEWVTARLIEFLPMSLADKQAMLVMDSFEERMDMLCKVLNDMGIN